MEVNKMTLTPQKYILRLKGKAWDCSQDLIEAIVKEDWEKVTSVMGVLYHMSGFDKLVEPYWAPLPIPKEEEVPRSDPYSIDLFGFAISNPRKKEEREDNE